MNTDNHSIILSKAMEKTGYEEMIGFKIIVDPRGNLEARNEKDDSSER